MGTRKNHPTRSRCSQKSRSNQNQTVGSATRTSTISTEHSAKKKKLHIILEKRKEKVGNFESFMPNDLEAKGIVFAWGTWSDRHRTLSFSMGTGDAPTKISCASFFFSLSLFSSFSRSRYFNTKYGNVVVGNSIPRSKSWWVLDWRRRGQLLLLLLLLLLFLLLFDCCSLLWAVPFSCFHRLVAGTDLMDQPLADK